MVENRADTFLRLIRRSQRGRLKIYLGYCAGVGKTYQMLLEGHRLKKDGIDVVIGLVETHGRPETAQLISGLEMVPRRRQEYRGLVVEEMDVDALLRRRPQAALIDELAHTNIPGSRNRKRYEDVQDILAAGIHVITTMNVQHLESLFDTVERGTGVKVRERLPDSVLTEADEIVDVDLAPEDLRRRLEEGKVYPVERINTALANFFRPSNLEKLRELTLRELVSQIDLRRRDTADEEGDLAPDQIMVCLSSRGPNSGRLLRYASRLAGKLNRNWYALYVRTKSEDPGQVDAETQRFISETLTLAKQLGAMVFTYKGDDVARTILRFAREYRVGHIVIGKPTPKPFWKSFGKNSNIVGDLLKQVKGVTIIVLDTLEPETPAVAPREAAPAHTSAGTDGATRRHHDEMELSSLLSARRIIRWDKPVLKEEVLRTLVAAATGQETDATRDGDTVFAAVMDREEQGSTFYNEGFAFPHVRIAGLPDPTVTLGITREGISDVVTERPVQLVFLILSALETPETQTRILALAARASQDRHLIRSLREAPTPDLVLVAIQDWEAAGRRTASGEHEGQGPS